VISDITEVLQPNVGRVPNHKISLRHEVIRFEKIVAGTNPPMCQEFGIVECCPVLFQDLTKRSPRPLSAVVIELKRSDRRKASNQRNIMTCTTFGKATGSAKQKRAVTGGGFDQQQLMQWPIDRVANQVENEIDNPRLCVNDAVFF